MTQNINNLLFVLYITIPPAILGYTFSCINTIFGTTLPTGFEIYMAWFFLPIIGGGLFFSIGYPFVGSVIDIQKMNINHKLKELINTLLGILFLFYSIIAPWALAINIEKNIIEIIFYWWFIHAHTYILIFLLTLDTKEE